MTRAGRSVFAFSLYLFALGLVLILAPNALLAAFGMSETSEVWIRVVGMLVLLLGYYYNGAARKNFTDFLRWTVHARFSVLAFLLAFVLFGLVSPTILLFGVIDSAAAVWTAIALRQDRTARPN
jgi:uncharacterized protein YjeT (DUF2065 family)